MLELNNITLLGIGGTPNKNEFDTLVKIAKHSLKTIKFGKVKILTGLHNINFTDPDIQIQHVNIPSYQEYSRFCIKRLNEYVDTDFCLIYHTDGFIINPHLWTDEFLQYDYIGAPWPLYFNWVDPNKRVGNGGFCLRSKKFLEESSKLNYTGGNEDYQLCYVFDEVLKRNGIKFAPVELASKFSLEMNTELNDDINKVFGFHGTGHGTGRDLYFISKL
jgi:hypothetical protein